MKNKAIHYLNDPARPFRWEWLILGVLFLILFSSFCYGDTKSIIHYEYNFWDALLHGDLMDFYQFSYDKAAYYVEQGIEGTSAANYDMTMYFLLGIWGAPLYFVCKLAGISELDNFATMLYGKFIFFVALCIAVYLVYRLLQKMNLDTETSCWGSFYFASSALVFSAIGVIGQSDILGIIFVLLGMCAYVDDHMLRFLLWFAIAFSFKGFAFFVFLPLLVLKVKNIFYIAVNALAVIGFTYLFNLPFVLNDSEGVAYKQNFAKEWFLNLLNRKLPLMDGEIPVLVFGMGLLLLWCYFRPKSFSPEQLEEHTIFVPLTALVILFASFGSFPYWYVYLTPFAAIAVVLHKENLERLVLLEVAAMAALLAGQYVHCYWCFDVHNGGGMLLDVLFGQGSRETVLYQIAQRMTDSTTALCNTAFLVCMVYFLYLIRPNGEMKKENNVSVRKYAIPRAGLNIVLTYIPVALYLANIWL